MVKLCSLLQDLPKIKVKEEWENIEITDLAFDSRTVTQGSLFIALRGGNLDGNAFISEAIARGAVAVIAEEGGAYQVPVIKVEDSRKALSLVAAAFYGNPSKKLKLVGVTGTNGKTTVTNMLSAIFTAAGKKTGVIGSLGAFFDGREFPCALTTPDPVYYQYLLSEMVKAGVEYCFSEISAHALFFEKEYSCRYRAVLFTNLTQDHLDFFCDMPSYGNAKKKLFCERESAYAVLNADDPFFRELLPFGECVTYGLNTPSDSFAVIEEESLRGTRFLMNLSDELCEVKLRLIGEFNVVNALAAATLARREGISTQAIGSGLSALKGVRGRLERAGEYGGGSIFVDFAHTPDGLEKSLSSLKKYCTGKLYCLFGCGGNRDRGKRPKMGKVASSLADGVILTSDNPRYEDPFAIISEIEAGVPKDFPCVAIEDRAEAVAYAVNLLRKGDVLLVAGKGAETYQECMGIKREYSDYNVIKKVIG